VNQLADLSNNPFLFNGSINQMKQFTLIITSFQQFAANVFGDRNDFSSALSDLLSRFETKDNSQIVNSIPLSVNQTQSIPTINSMIFHFFDSRQGLIPCKIEILSLPSFNISSMWCKKTQITAISKTRKNHYHAF
jgi:hypothetical protein